MGTGLSDFAGGVGAVAQGYDAKMAEDQRLAAGKIAMQRGDLQNQQLQFQNQQAQMSTEDMARQYQEAKGGRAAFKFGDSIDDNFNNAIQYHLQQGDPQAAQALQTIHSNYTATQLHQTALAAITSPDPAAFGKTWQAMDPKTPMDPSSFRRLTPADVAAGGEFAGQPQFAAGDIVGKRADTGAPLHWNTQFMAHMTGVTKPGKWTEHDGTAIESDTGQMKRGLKPNMVKVKDENGNEVEVDYDSNKDWVDARARATGEQTWGRKQDNDLRAAMKDVYKSDFTSLNPEEQRKYNEQMGIAKNLIQMGGKDSVGFPLTPSTAVGAAQRIIESKGTIGPADYGIKPGAAPGTPSAAAPEPALPAEWNGKKPAGAAWDGQNWTQQSNGKTYLYRSPGAPQAPAAPGQPAGSNAAPVTPAPAAAAAPTPATSIQPQATPAAQPDPKQFPKLQGLNQTQLTRRANQLQAFIQSGQQMMPGGAGSALTPGGGMSDTRTREQAMQELQLIQRMLPAAPPGPSGDVPPFQSFASGGIARALRPSVQPSVRGGIARALG